MSEPTTDIAIFTRNLRVCDNPVLSAAAQSSERVLPVFVHDPGIAGRGFSNPRRQRVLEEGLADLGRSLRDLGAGLVVAEGDPIAEICRLAERHHARAVHLAADVSGYALRRERELHRALAAQRRELIVHESVVTLQPTSALSPTGSDHYRVFTPYFRRWRELPPRPVSAAPQRLRLPDALDPDQVLRPDSLPEGAGGESTARNELHSWADDGVTQYQDRHDDLAADATSKLSAALHFGFISAVELADRVRRHRGPGSDAFVRQLAWRDFHHQVLAARPKAAWQDYRERNDTWRRSEEELEAWRSGRTGFPLVDAGMRQLAETGWMHNRARLVVASFLTKTLYQDWRIGAQHFLDHLIDGDLANNNLNWQWVAGTGTDTRPNRVLNPVRQASRYDPDADYIRRWIPELAELANSEAHRPWQLPADRRRALEYPDTIVDLDAARDRFLAARGRS